MLDVLRNQTSAFSLFPLTVHRIRHTVSLYTLKYCLLCRSVGHIIGIRDCMTFCTVLSPSSDPVEPTHCLTSITQANDIITTPCHHYSTQALNLKVWLQYIALLRTHYRLPTTLYC